MDACSCSGTVPQNPRSTKCRALDYADLEIDLTLAANHTGPYSTDIDKFMRYGREGVLHGKTYRYSAQSSTVNSRPVRQL